MGQNQNASRRTIVTALMVAPTLSTVTIGPEPSVSDVNLIALGKRLDTTSAALDHAAGHDEAIALLDKIESISAEIVATPAKTLQGLAVKARATAWALEHDCGLLDPMKKSTINDRVAASIVRDLLNLRMTNA